MCHTSLSEHGVGRACNWHPITSQMCLIGKRSRENDSHLAHHFGWRMRCTVERSPASKGHCVPLKGEKCPGTVNQS
ncbi:hypothetical protein TNCV_2112121 [Trichonephila clavipes]|nr:hypothetical protein TNCV_2112121 [Trichonephila clavipes]